MWDQVTFKDQLIPSNETLYRHYRRSSWVTDYWRKASNNNMQLLPVTSFGWKLDRDEALQIEWDSDENIENIKECITFLLRGCKCTKSKCSTQVCSCRKAGRLCGPGCSCTGCTNKPSQLFVCSQTTHKMYRHRRPHIHQHALVQLPLSTMHTRYIICLS